MQNKKRIRATTTTTEEKSNGNLVIQFNVCIYTILAIFGSFEMMLKLIPAYNRRDMTIFRFKCWRKNVICVCLPLRFSNIQHKTKHINIYRTIIIHFGRFLSMHSHKHYTHLLLAYRIIYFNIKNIESESESKKAQKHKQQQR